MSGIIYLILMLIVAAMGYFMVTYSYGYINYYINQSMPINDTNVTNILDIGDKLVFGWLYVMFVVAIVTFLVLSYRKARAGL